MSRTAIASLSLCSSTTTAISNHPLAQEMTTTALRTTDVQGRIRSRRNARKRKHENAPENGSGTREDVSIEKDSPYIACSAVTLDMRLAVLFLANRASTAIVACTRADTRSDSGSSAMALPNLQEEHRTWVCSRSGAAFAGLHVYPAFGKKILRLTSLTARARATTGSARSGRGGRRTGGQRGAA